MIALDYQSPQDAADAAKYWREHDVKKFAVDVTAGPAKKLTYARTWYCRARTPERAIACIRRDAPNLPSPANFRARLAGPRELGCVPTGGLKR